MSLEFENDEKLNVNEESHSIETNTKDKCLHVCHPKNKEIEWTIYEWDREKVKMPGKAPWNVNVIVTNSDKYLEKRFTLIIHCGNKKHNKEDARLWVDMLE